METEIKKRIHEEISNTSPEIVNLIQSGYTVTLRPTKGSVKITSHKERVVKNGEKDNQSR